MTVYETLLKQQYDRGFNDARDLRARAPEMTGTDIINEEIKIPRFDGTKDYSSWAVGAPVKHEDQVYKLLQPYNAANYEGTPATLPALWSICHTTNPYVAKPYMAPNGTSGMYMKDECCTENGKTYKCLTDNNVYAPSAYAPNWEEVDFAALEAEAANVEEVGEDE